MDENMTAGPSEAQQNEGRAMRAKALVAAADERDAALANVRNAVAMERPTDEGLADAGDRYARAENALRAMVSLVPAEDETMPGEGEPPVISGGSSAQAAQETPPPSV